MSLGENGSRVKRRGSKIASIEFISASHSSERIVSIAPTFYEIKLSSIIEII